jgi:hypothetical protein
MQAFHSRHVGSRAGGLQCDGLCNGCDMPHGLGRHAAEHDLDSWAASPSALCHVRQRMVAHAREYDDVFERAPMHAYSTILPAASAVGEAEDRTGKELFTAVTVAADVQCRVALGYPLQDVWHPSAARGYIGAAVGAGKMLGLEAERMYHTLGLAFQQMSGTRQALSERAQAKRMQAGFSVRAGVFAAYLARAGLTSPQDSLDGEYGMARAFGRNTADAQRVTAELGRRYDGMNLSMKPFPCHRTTHAAVEAALRIVAEEPLAAKVRVVPEPDAGSWTPVEVSVQCRGGDGRPAVWRRCWAHQSAPFRGRPDRQSARLRPFRHHADA